MTVVDIGANQGLYTMLFSQLVGPQGTVVSFEPEADMYRALVDNVSRNRATNVEYHNVALGSKAGTATLSRSLVHGGDNRLAPGHNENTSRKESVPVNTLDELVGGRSVDFIKIDVQGWEGEVFHGMKSVLENNRAVLIHFEFWPKGLRMAGCEPGELLKGLSNQGFQLFEVGEREYRPVSDFSRLIEHLSGNRFSNLLAKR
jgi:FkbM family methyltransferase